MNDRPRLLERELESLMRQAYSPAARAGMSATQKREIRRMFMAGAQAFSRLLMANLEHTETDEPTAQDLALMDALQAELAAFGQDLNNGLA